MISTLDEAWRWYEASRRSAQVGTQYWDELPWTGSLGRDDTLGLLEATQIVGMAEVILGDLDDLCVLLLFSIFEAKRREQAQRDVAEELPEVHHPVLLQALANLNDSIEHGSFYRVLEAYKKLDQDLIEEINQVRRYRNWVAHGRRSPQPDNVSPEIAYNRLGRFLKRLAETEIG